MGRGRWLSVCVVVAGCGRIDFDPHVAGADAAAGPPSSFGDFCRFGQATVIQSGIVPDDTMAAGFPAAVMSGCSTNLLARQVSQDAAGILDGTTGRPLLAPDDLGLIGGGDYYQRSIAYLLMSDMPVTFGTGTAGTVQLVERATGIVVYSYQSSTITPSHDVGLVQFVREPISGGTYLSAMGSGTAGTLAAGYLFTTRIAPSIGADRHAWYALDWTEADATQGPSPGDVLSIVAAGP